MSYPPNPIDRSSIFAESKRIQAANNAHFLVLVLSSLFISPLFICLTSLLTFLHFILSQSNAVSLDPFSFVLSYYESSTYSIALSLLYALLVLSLYVAGVATITYSTKQVLYGKPPNLSSTINSLSKSFFPLASTTLTSLACLLSACIAFLLFFGSLLNSLQILGFQINYSLKFPAITFSVIIGLFLISFHVYLILAAIISVIESKWGFEPLRRSFILVRGMKQSSMSILMLHGISIWVIALGLSTQIFTTDGPWNYLQVLQIFYISLFWTMFMAPLVISYTVLYLNCKDLHKESGFDIATEISKECVSLAIDDTKLVSESNVKLIVRCALLMVVCVTVVLVARCYQE